MKMRQERSRNICFTSFLEEKVEYDESIMQYMIIGSEICPKSGKHHWQGYIQFKEQVYKKDMAKILGSKKIHWDTAKGNAEENEKYCSKDGDYEEYGSKKKQGERTDLMAVANLVKEGKNMLEIVMERPVEYIKFNRGIEKLMAIRDKYMRRAEREVEVYVLIGPSGCGKTRLAYQNDNGLYKIVCEENRPLWFDGYEGEKTLLIDEMGPNCIAYNFLLGLLDRYEIRLPVKGGFTYASWETVFITSNLPMEKWWYKNDISALKRRITRVKVFGEGATLEAIPVGHRHNVAPKISEVNQKYQREISEMDLEKSTQKWRGNTKARH